MDNLDFSPLLISMQLAIVTTCVLLSIGLPLAWWLTNTNQRFSKSCVETLVALPLVLPPTVLGFYLLLLLGEHGPLGKLSCWLTGSSLAFTFTGLVIGSSLYSLPFVVQPLQTAFTAIGNTPYLVATTLKATKLDYFFTIHLPLARRGLLTAAVLGFAHTIGEFGVVLMLGGNIPDKTKVASIAIYDLVESMEYSQAHLFSAGLLLFACLALFILFTINQTDMVKR